LRRVTRSAGIRDARAAAVALLARSDLASLELRLRLEARGYPGRDIESALATLREEGLLDDTRHAHAQVLSRSGRGQGPVRIRAHLLEVGLPESLVEAALATGPDWTALADQVRRRRFGDDRPTTPAAVARQARFLQQRGFSSDQIRAVTGAELDPEW
jgi:regulatory protein